MKRPTRAFVLGLMQLLLAAACEQPASGTKQDGNALKENCPPATVACGDSCVDVMSSVAHCGACDVACDTGSLCSAGVCVERCVEGTTECAGACVNTQTDAHQCGACGQACAANERCLAGSCASCVTNVLDTKQFPIDMAFDTRSASDVLRGSCAAGNSPETAVAFTAPKDGVYEFSTEGSSFNTVLYVLDGDCDGKELACNDDYKGELSSWLSLELRQGQKVSVVVDGLDSQAGEGRLHVVDANGLVCCETHASGGCGVRTIEECVCAHDAFCCQSAWDAGCIETMLENGCGRCAASGDCESGPVAEGPLAMAVDLTTGKDSVHLSCGELGVADALFDFTAGDAGLYRFSTRDSMGDTVLGVLASPSCDAQELACNDDGLGGVASELTTFLTAKQSVLIAVEAFEGVTKATSLRVERVGSPPDMECGAIPLTSEGLAVASGRLHGQTSGPKGSCALDLGGTNLYAFKAPTAGRYQFDTTGSAVDTTLAAFAGCTGAELACNDDNAQGWGSTLVLELAAEQEIMISVASFENGEYSLAYGLEGTPGITFSGTGCCSEHDVPGCKVQEIAQCVCGAYAYCCEQGWDALCVEAVDQLGCGTCQ